MLGCTSCLNLLASWCHSHTPLGRSTVVCSSPALQKRLSCALTRRSISCSDGSNLNGPFFEPPLDGSEKQSRRKKQQEQCHVLPSLVESCAPGACIALCVPPGPVWSCRREGKGREYAFPKQTMYWKAGMGASNTSLFLWPGSPAHGRKTLGKSYLPNALS